MLVSVLFQLVSLSLSYDYVTICAKGRVSFSHEHYVLINKMNKCNSEKNGFLGYG